MKSIPINGEVHNTYVTPDGRFVVAGSIAGKSLTVVNSRLNSTVYVHSLPDLTLTGAVDVGVAPYFFTLAPDGRTACVANAGSNSVSVVDVVAMREVMRIPVGQVPNGTSRRRCREAQGSGLKP